MLRETTFFWGGMISIALGAVLAVALGLGGAGAPFTGAWVGAAAAVGMGVFFCGSEERRADTGEST